MVATNSNQTDVPITNGFTEEIGKKKELKNDIKDNNLAAGKDIMMIVHRFHIDLEKCMIIVYV